MKPFVSVLIASFNTNNKYIKECIYSIQRQEGDFGIELVWINDGSDEEHTIFLEKELDEFKNTSIDDKIVYKKFEKNMGLSYCLHEGLLLCTNELIIRMDSDDIMTIYRIQIQIDFMKNNKDCVMCGSHMYLFKDELKEYTNIHNISEHPNVLSWDEYIDNKVNGKYKQWILNHPTLCFKKSAVIEVGNYNKNLRLPFEDLDLELRILRKYGVVHNIPYFLLYYRIHDNQQTEKFKNDLTINEKIQKHINNIIFELKNQ